jgi:hypothetical protein
VGISQIRQVGQDLRMHLHVLWKRKNNDTEVPVFTVDNFEILQVSFKNSSTDSNIHIGWTTSLS